MTLASHSLPNSKYFSLLGVQNENSGNIVQSLMFFKVVTGKLKSYGVTTEYKNTWKKERNAHMQRENRKDMHRKKRREKNKHIKREME